MKKTIVTASVLAVSVLALTGCVHNQPKTPAAEKSPMAAHVTVDSKAQALLPAAIRSAGTLEIGTNLTYAPDEFKDPNGAPTGWGIALATAISEKLGLKPNFHDSQFDNILPGLQGGKYDIGWASFTDNQEREKVVDFVDYYTAGVQWASLKGKNIDPMNACGLTVAVGTGTYQETDEIPAKSAACVAAGKAAINKLKLDTQTDITNAVVLGRADAMSADSPVTQYAVKQTGDKLQLTGSIMESAPFGAAVAKSNSSLRDAVAAATQSLIDDGTYAQILDEWGVQAGAVKKVMVNGAAN
ncbi:ABC transporter substrate-binding protein [Microbacterium candidum]|uniref:ABC transporter substrate-binding protein n=1 Tax=Microbacterium candidum TaxID=3041922 RepID=A0ABT7N3I1_9MICO|nr:ABC transporter substrate-binding protein [Microbacterium sp. ASV49]MDL9981265.1 ABC transporter substrate-binding protein [Microbacterium sp. ASV49]